MVKIRNIPEYVVHGDDDRTVAVTQSRNMVEAGKKAGAEIVYVEVPGGSHVGVAAPAFAAMLDFFARQQKARRASIAHRFQRAAAALPVCASATWAVSEKPTHFSTLPLRTVKKWAIGVSISAPVLRTVAW